MCVHGEQLVWQASHTARKLEPQDMEARKEFITELEKRNWDQQRRREGAISHRIRP